MSRNIPIEIDENILINAPFPSFALNKSGEIVSWNENCKEAFGYTIQDFQNNNSLKAQFLPSISEEQWERILEAQECIRLDHIEIVHKDESLINATLVLIPCKIQQDLQIVVYCLTDDQFTRIGADQELLDLKNGLLSSFMMVTLDQEGFIINCNPLFLKTSHWTPKRVLGKTFWQLFPETEESIEVTDHIWNTISSGQIWQGEVEKITRDGETYWVHLTAIPTYSEAEQAYRYVLIEQDITKGVLLQQQLERIAYIDTETGLMNAHRLENVVEEMVSEGQHFYFVYLSIDKFYTLRELHNIQLENNLIVEFTKRLKIYFQDSHLARINESDFVVITPLGEWYIQGFLTYLKQNPIYNGNRAMPITVSGGVTRSPQDQSQLYPANERFPCNHYKCS